MFETTALCPRRAQAGAQGWVRAALTSFGVAFAVCLALLPAAAAARQPAAPARDAVPRSAHRPAFLVLFGEDPSQPATYALEQGIGDVLASGRAADAPVLYYEFLDATRFEEQRYRDVVSRFLRDKYSGVDVDLIVPIAQGAIEFLAAERDALWPGVPILFVVTHTMSIDPAAVLPDAAGLVFDHKFADSLETARAVLPATRQVAIVTGASALEEARTVGGADDVRRAGLNPIDLRGLSMPDLLSRVSALPPHTVVFVSGPLVAADGRVSPIWTLCEMISIASNSPTFMMGASQLLGCGVTGGAMRDFAAMGRTIGERALALHRTFTREIVAVPAARFTALSFDARQLARWRIDERALPPGSTVQFRPFSLWREYRGEVLVALAGLAIQSILIVGLLYERRKRHTAEFESRRSLSLAAHVDRRVAMAALTGSIAHELAQPLGSILHNAEAAEMLLATDRASTENLQEILREIRTEDARAAQIVQRHRAMLRRHDLDTHAIDIHAVVRESLALVAHDAMARHVQLEARLPAAPCLVAGDQVLLQQVMVNLVINAMDAMAEIPAGRRRVTVRNAVVPDGVEVSVCDSGPGLPPEINGRLFEPFVTTKSDGIGIGLTIARSIIEAHSGTIDARNNADGGVTFRFTLPLAVAT